jgi:hypothetical protein
MNVILLYNNHRHILATYVSHVQGGENKNTIIMCRIFILDLITPEDGHIEDRNMPVIAM